VRKRIIGLTVLAAALAIALFGIPLAGIVVRYVVHDERGELERIADRAAVSACADLVRGRPPGALPPTGADTHLALYDAAGNRSGGSGPATADPTARAALTGTTSSGDINGDIVVAVPLQTGTTVLGAIRAATPRAEAYTRIAGIWSLMAGLGLVAVIGAWLVARTLSSRLSRPLDQLVLTANALGHGDFSARSRFPGLPEIDSVGAALNRTATRLGEMVARERAFSADASHQLRTPLTGLRLGLEIALEDPDRDPREALRSAVATTDRLQRTVEDLLQLARDTDRPAEPLHLTQLLGELSDTWGTKLAANRRALTVTEQPWVPASRASTASVRQILAVLLDNAVTHGTGAVTVTIRDAGNALAIDVANRGPAITVSSEQLFARRSPDAKGHGIGLALARRLAEAEGGRLGLTQTSPPTFTLLAPALNIEHLIPVQSG
jgi:signal transduction histidine kinase